MQVGKQPSPEQTTPQLERQAVTQLLKRLSAGDRDAFDHLVPLVYDQLRRLASRSLRSQRPDHTLRATALVHEAYLRLADAGGDWQDRVHFYSVAAQMMRGILVDAARARRSGKRGGDVVRVNLDDGPEIGRSKDRELVALDDALNALSQIDPRQVRVIELCHVRQARQPFTGYEGMRGGEPESQRHDHPGADRDQQEEPRLGLRAH